jgi:hypothetical protein
MSKLEIAEITIIGTGANADMPVRLVIDLPLDDSLDVVIGTALRTAATAGLLHAAIDEVVATCKVRPGE